MKIDTGERILPGLLEITKVVYFTCVTCVTWVTCVTMYKEFVSQNVIRFPHQILWSENCAHKNVIKPYESNIILYTCLYYKVNNRKCYQCTKIK